MQWKTLLTPKGVPRLATKYRSRGSLPDVTSGTCLLFEEEFKKCLRIEPASGRNVNFPLNLTASDQEPIASDWSTCRRKVRIVFMIWRCKKRVPRVDGDVPTIRQMLPSHGITFPFGRLPLGRLRDGPVPGLKTTLRASFCNCNKNLRFYPVINIYYIALNYPQFKCQTNNF